MRSPHPVLDHDSRSYDVPPARTSEAEKEREATSLEDRIAVVVTDVMRRRSLGEFLPDASVTEAHPGLMPRLTEALISLEQVRRAKLAAERAGPLDGPLVALS